MGKLLISLITLSVVGLGVYWSSCCCKHKQDLSAYRQDGYFGRKILKAGEKLPLDDKSLRPFVVNVSDASLADLKDRLSKARYTNALEDSQFNYGFPGHELRKVIDHWRNKYDWRREEAKLNAHPQFLTQIEGLDIHFVRVKPSKPAKVIVPLLVVHGWPGSVLEYYKSFPLLSEPDAQGMAFEVIAPSIPGYGWSEASHKKGLNALVTARIFNKLMKRLGHERYVAHGGDWGSLIIRSIAYIYPESVIGAHQVGGWAPAPKTACEYTRFFLAMLVPRLYFHDSADAMVEHGKMFPLSDKFSLLLRETGYFHLQATKPDSVGAALVDSPVGLAAYILEKFSTWTNFEHVALEDGGLSKRFTLDELLTNVMIYWTSDNVASSMRYYKENIPMVLNLDFFHDKMTVPAAIVDPVHELMHSPRKMCQPYFANLVQFSDFPRGGHFTAFEEPQLMSDDIRAFVHKVRQLEDKKTEKKAAKAEKKTEM